MKNNVLTKLRCFFLFLGMRLKIFWYSIIMPLKIPYELLKYCSQLIATSKDLRNVGPKKGLKRRKLEKQDKL